MRKRVFTAIFSLVVLSSMAVLGSTTELIGRILKSVSGSLTGETINIPLANKQPEVVSILPTPDEVNVKQIDIPDEILWRVILDFPEKFNILAENARLNGQNETIYTEYFTRQANLSLENSEIFKKKAFEYSAEINPVKNRMQEIGSYIKTNRDSGQKLSKDKSWALREELRALQEKQKELVLKYRKEISDVIDADSFAGFESWLRTDFAAHFSAKRITPKDATTTPNSNIPNNGFTLIEKNKQEENQK